MADPPTQAQSAEPDVLRLVRELVREVGSGRALPSVEPGADLDRELGIGSLERVELLVRLEAAFKVELPETTVARARTVQDLICAVEQASAVSPGVPGAPIPLEPAPGSVEARSADPARPAPSTAQQAATLVDLLQRRAAETPDALHIGLREEEGVEARISYRDLLFGATSVAAGLRETLPLAAPVGLIFPTGREFFESFFGVLLAGGIPVPLYPPHRLDQIEEYAARQANILGNAEARFLLAAHEAQGLAKLLQARVRCLEGVAEPAEIRRRHEGSVGIGVHAGDIAFLQYTSGSTGAPKGVALTHANLMANLKAIHDGCALTPADVTVTWLPLYHDLGLIGTWLGALYAGIPTHVSSPMAFLTRPQRWLWAIHRHRATITAAPNFAYALCAKKLPERALEGLDLSCWRIAVNGAEPICPETLELFCSRFAKYGFRREAMFPAYGLAENCVALTFPPPGRGPRIDVVERVALLEQGKAAPATSGDANPARFVGVGQAVLGSEIRLLDGDSRPVGERVIGRIQFRGTSATAGYYKNPEATSELVGADGWHATGDLGYVADGELYVTGRTKDLIIKAGRNLSPQEVEEIAGGVEGVRAGSVAAFAVPGKDGTEALVVVAETRAEGAERERIVRTIIERVIAVIGVTPDDVVLAGAGSVLKTSSGKIRRSACRELYLRGELRAARKRAPWAFLARAAVERGWFQAREALRRAAVKLYGVWALGVIYAGILVTWTVIRWRKPGPCASAWVRRGARLALLIAGLRPRVIGGERLAGSGPRVIIANHSSYLDAIVLYAVLPGEPRTVAKAELLSSPLTATFIEKTGALTVRRGNAQESVDDAARIDARIAAGDTMVFFPEGTFTRQAGLRPFKLGAFKSAAAVGAEIVPIALRGVREVLRDRTRLPRPGRIEVHVGPSIRPQGNDWQEVVRLRDLCREWIAAECGEPALDLVRAGLPIAQE